MSKQDYSAEISDLESLISEQINNFELSISEQAIFIDLKFRSIRKDYFLKNNIQGIKKLDLVDLIYDINLHPYKLPNSIEQQLQLFRLLILKLSFEDDSFFIQATNPFSEFIDQTSEAVTAYIKTDNEHLFCQILAEQIQEIFKSQHQLKIIINGFTKEQNKTFKTGKSNLPKTTQPIDDQRTIKCKITIENLLKKSTLNKNIRAFLIQVWSKVLAHILETHGENSKQWEQGNKLVSIIVWSLHKNRVEKDYQKISKLLPVIFDSISSGLIIIKELDLYFDPIRKELTKEYTRLFKRILIKQKKLTSKNKLPTVNTPPLILSKEVENINELRIIESLKKGDWLQYKQANNKTNIKLIWISTDLSEFIFVNREGVKVKQLSCSELVKELQDGTLISPSSQPNKFAKNLSVLKTIG